IDAVTWPAGIPHHSWQVVSCGKSGIGYKGMLMAAKVLACTAIELFECPDKLKAAREEFLRRSASGYVCPIEPGEQPKAI
ncbi:MAG TPA: amidohydrolase, partial [Candidatus Limivicinus faecipullorum]|nr:amidohydrolase [Candidatus Limivicinus faecipullorum]